MSKSSLETAELVSRTKNLTTFYDDEDTLHEQPATFFNSLAEQIKNDPSYTSLLLHKISLALWDKSRIRGFFIGIAGNHSLSTLILDRNDLHEWDDARIRAFGMGIAGSRFFSTLALNGNNLCDWDEACIRAFVAGIAESRSLSTLVLKSNNLCGWNEACIGAFVTGITKSSSLSTLDLGSNDLESWFDTRIHAFFTGVAGSRSLSTLNLQDNNLGYWEEAYIDVFVAGIARSRSLSTLNLQDNNLGHWDEACIEAFFTGIAGSRSLSTLNLQNNNLHRWDKTCIRAFVNGIVASPITTLQLDTRTLDLMTELNFKILMDLLQVYPNINIEFSEVNSISDITSVGRRECLEKYRDLNKLHDALIVSQMLETSEWMMKNGSAAKVDPKIFRIIVDNMSSKQQENWEEVSRLLGHVDSTNGQKFQKMIVEQGSLDNVRRVFSTLEPSAIDSQRFLSRKPHFGFWAPVAAAIKIEGPTCKDAPLTKVTTVPSTSLFLVAQAEQEQEEQQKKERDCYLSPLIFSSAPEPSLISSAKKLELYSDLEPKEGGVREAIGVLLVLKKS
jgi:hypothetical protein